MFRLVKISLPSGSINNHPRLSPGIAIRE